MTGAGVCGGGEGRWQELNCCTLRDEWLVRVGVNIVILLKVQTDRRDLELEVNESSREMRLDDDLRLAHGELEL